MITSLGGGKPVGINKLGTAGRAIIGDQGKRRCRLAAIGAREAWFLTGSP